MPAPSSTAPFQSFVCPKCGLANPSTAYFCTACHQILIHRCPKCWHEQRTGTLCEKCGTCFALFWEQAFERSCNKENRLWWAKFAAATRAYFQVLFLPFLGLRGAIRALIARLISFRLSNR